MRRYVLTAIVLVGIIGVAAGAAMWQQQIPVGLSGTQVVTQVAGRLPVIRQPFTLPDGLLRGGTYRSIQAVQDPDGTITVRGFAEIVDREPLELQYAWLLRVYQGKTLVLEHHYLPSVLDPGQMAATPRFVDNIQLKPGDYRIMLLLYGTRRGFDSSTLKFGQEYRPYAHSPVGMSRITVQ